MNAVIYNIKESNKVPLIPLYAFVELTPLTDVSQAVFSFFPTQPYLCLAGRDDEFKVVPFNVRVVAVGQAPELAMAKPMSPDERVLLLGALIDGDDTPVAAGEDDKSVILAEGVLGRSLHGVMEGDHCHDACPAPRLRSSGHGPVHICRNSRYGR
ncbi:MAG: hypothetical protein WDK95_15585 [Syntrophorhabdaceae bacterium]|nr:hypothetical protein [Syntrophorhabdaceae bacterium]